MKKLAREVAFEVKFFRLLLLLSLFDFTSKHSWHWGKAVQHCWSKCYCNKIIQLQHKYLWEFQIWLSSNKKSFYLLFQFLAITPREIVLSKSLQEDFTLKHHTEISARMYCSSPFQVEKQSLFCAPLCLTLCLKANHHLSKWWDLERNLLFESNRLHCQNNVSEELLIAWEQIWY